MASVARLKKFERCPEPFKIGCFREAISAFGGGGGQAPPRNSATGCRAITAER